MHTKTRWRAAAVVAAILAIAVTPLIAGAQLPYTVNVDANAEYGDILVGPNGHTLYVFDVDEPGVSNCNDGCAAAWPPLLVEAGETPNGGMEVTGALSVITRDDGGMQVAINDRPLYYWASDAAPGDATGQGVNDVWWVVDSAGTAITTAPAQATPTPAATAEPTAAPTQAPAAAPDAGAAGNAGLSAATGTSGLLIAVLITGIVAVVIGARRLVRER